MTEHTPQEPNPNDDKVKVGLSRPMVDDDLDENTVTRGMPKGSQDSPWNEADIASFITHPGLGRVLCIGSDIASAVEVQLQDAQYQVGHLKGYMPVETLVHATTTFLPDVIYLALDEPFFQSLEALDALASDARTQSIPLLALVNEHAPASLIEEAYSRTGCDFFRVSHTRVELLARTHLLVRLTRSTNRSNRQENRPNSDMTAANDPTTGRIDLRDPVSGLFSTEYFFHRMPTEIARARRYRRVLSILAIRCPEAKYSASSAIQLATTLNQHIRESDICSRVEPDLFVCLLPEVSSDGIDSLENRIRSSLSRLGLNCGFGRAGLDGHHRSGSPQDLLERARKNASATFGG